MLAVVMLSVPPSGMAFRAFTTRFIMTCAICRKSADSVGRTCRIAQRHLEGDIDMHPIAVWNDFLELNGRAGCEHTHVVRPQGIRNVLREESIVCFLLHRFVRNVEQFLML